MANNCIIFGKYEYVNFLVFENDLRAQNQKMTEWKSLSREGDMCTICFSEEGAPEFPRKREIDELCSLSPLPHTTSTQGDCEIFVLVILRNFREIFNFKFCKIRGKFCITRNKNFAKVRKRKFGSHPTFTQAAVCYSPSPSVCQKILQCGTAMLL